MARILIANDRKSIRTEVRTSFRKHTDWQVCGEAEDGRETMAKAVELQPDLIVIDFKMALADGLKASSEIGLSMPNVPIVMYTLHKTRELEVAAKIVGIRQVVGKEDGAKELLSAIEAELAAKKYLHEPGIPRPARPSAQN
jgi:two-component system, NarL family, response regulator NreC